MKKRILAVLLVMVMLAGCASAGSSNTSTAPEGAGQVQIPQQEGGSDKSETKTLYIAQQADPQTLDPQYQSDTFSMTPISAMFDTLIRQDADGEFLPCLADSWEYLDDTTIVFHLNPNIYFHNGDKMTAEDVEYSILRAMESPHTASRINFVDPDKIVIIDDNTIELGYLYPFSPALNNFAMTQNAIVPKSVCSEMTSAEFGRNPVGTGPYKFVSWKTGDSVTMERFDDYYGEKAKIKNVVFRCIVENANRAIELETGGVQFSYDILPADLPRLEALDNVHMFRGPNFGRGYIGFNNQKAPFDNPAIREALAHSIDRESILDAVYNNVGIVGNGPLVSIEASYNPNVPVYEYDMEKARQMLADAGFEGADGITIYCNQNQLRIDVAEIVQNVWAQLGINCRIEVLEYGAFMETVIGGGHNVVILGWPGIGDADNPLYSLYHTSAIGATNYTHYSNPEVDKMIEEGRSTIDDAARDAIYQDIQVKIVEDVPAIFYWEGENTNAYSTELKEIQYTPYVIRFGDLEWA